MDTQATPPAAHKAEQSSEHSRTRREPLHRCSDRDYCTLVCGDFYQAKKKMLPAGSGQQTAPERKRERRREGERGANRTCSPRARMASLVSKLAIWHMDTSVLPLLPLESSWSSRQGTAA